MHFAKPETFTMTQVNLIRSFFIVAVAVTICTLNLHLKLTGSKPTVRFFIDIKILTQ